MFKIYRSKCIKMSRIKKKKKKNGIKLKVGIRIQMEAFHMVHMILIDKITKRELDFLFIYTIK